MEQDRRLELIDLAIQKLIQDNRNKGTHHSDTNDEDAEYQLALTHLLSASQLLGMMQRDEPLQKQSQPSIHSEVAANAIQKTEAENVSGGEVDCECKGIETDEIVKELKKVKRQNFVTHCLLSVMIVLTVAWQLSEVSLIMKVKDGINHPFRSFRSMLKGMVKVPDMDNGQEPHNREHQSESPSLPSLNIPEMSNVAVQNLGFNNGEH